MTQDGIGLVQPDDWRINMNDPWQVLWWSRYLGLSKTELESVIRMTGSVIVDIKQYLASHGNSLHAIQAPAVPKPHVSIPAKGHGFMF